MASPGRRRGRQRMAALSSTIPVGVDLVLPRCRCLRRRYLRRPSLLLLLRWRSCPANSTICHFCVFEMQRSQNFTVATWQAYN
uniref:Uncharacterized protein n=1 Tax=Aegilops tauschii TaxID=37682 RepID=M8BBS0_AEGTA